MTAGSGVDGKPVLHPRDTPAGNNEREERRPVHKTVREQKAYRMNLDKVEEESTENPLVFKIKLFPLSPAGKAELLIFRNITCEALMMLLVCTQDQNLHVKVELD